MTTKLVVTKTEHTMEWTTPFINMWGNWIPPSDPSKTVLDIFMENAAKQPQKPFLGERQPLPDGKFGDFHWMSWGNAGSSVENIGSGIISLGIAPPGSNVGIFRFVCFSFSFSPLLKLLFKQSKLSRLGFV